MNENIVKLIQIAVYTAGFISIFSLLSIVIIFLYELKRNKTTPAFELIFNLSICELVNTVAFLLNYFPHPTDKENLDSTICEIQAPLIFFSETAQHIMATIISFYILSLNSQANKINENSKLVDFITANENEKNKRLSPSTRLLYIFICYGLSALLALIGVYFGIFGVSKFNCWISEDHSMVIGIYYCVICVLIFVNFLISIKIFRMKFSFLDDEEKKHRLEFSKSLSYYPIITLISFLVFTFSRILMQKDEAFVLLDHAVNIVFNLLSGFFYALVCFNSFRFRRKLSKWVRRFSVRSSKNTCEQLEAKDIRASLAENVIGNSSKDSSLIDEDEDSACSRCFVKNEFSP